jgi:hypothetical protein
VVAGAFAILACLVTVWLAIDRRPPEWDHANHLERALRCAEDLGAGKAEALLGGSAFYPPLVPCSAGLLQRLGLSDTAAGGAVMLGFLGLGMASTFLLGRALAGGAAGVVAALLFGTAPFTVFLALRFQLDLPLASLVALALLALLRSDGFRHRGWSLAAGVVLALGLLTKPPFLVFVLGPLAVVAVQTRDRVARINGLLGLGACAILSLPWYGPRILTLPQQIMHRSFKHGAEEGDPGLLTAGALAWYPRHSVMTLGLAATVLVCVGLVVAARRRAWFALTGLLAPLAIFAVVQNKDLRYTVPLLGAAAVIAGIGFAALPGRVRPAAGAVLGLGALVQVSATAWGIPERPRLPVLDLQLAVPSPPRAGDWRHREILDLIARDARGQERRVSIVPNEGPFSVSNFRYYGLRDRRGLEFRRPWDQEPLWIDYMVVKTGSQGPSWPGDKARRIMDRFARDPYLGLAYPVIGQFTLPDGSVASVRARQLPAGLAVTPGALASAIEAGLRRRMPDFAREVEGLRIRLVHDDRIIQGRVERIEIAAAAATLAEFRRREPARLRVHDLRLAVDDVLVNPWSALGAERFDLLAAGRLGVEGATVLDGDFQAFLRGLRTFRVAVTLEEGALGFALRQPGPDVEGRVRITSVAGRPPGFIAERVRIGSLSVPAGLVNWLIQSLDPLPGLARRAEIPIDVGEITVTAHALHIGGGPGYLEGRRR